MIYIGTSGWMYKDWGKEFYPKNIQKDHLSFYAEEFSTVEINNTFYHLPKLSTFKKWARETPEHFVFSVKLSRYITHGKKLVGIRAPLKKFLRRAAYLRQKLGPILVQLPPYLHFNEEVLNDFVDAALATGVSQFALEPRSVSWMHDAEVVRRILSKANMALVFPHSSKIPSFEAADQNITANFVYIRFHGPSEFAASSYGLRRLQPWAKKIDTWHQSGLDIFVYFNNDRHGNAIHDARTLIHLLKSSTRSPARVTEREHSVR